MAATPAPMRWRKGRRTPPHLTTCDQCVKLAGLRDAMYKTRSFYQKVAWSKNAKKPDVCVSLDDILQICNSYQPHYHVLYVHFIAVYSLEMKQIVFIRDGDTMLMDSNYHDILHLIINDSHNQGAARVVRCSCGENHKADGKEGVRKLRSGSVKKQCK